jgi:hypothetical protein
VACGAFLELAVIAAAQRGVSVQLELFPDGAPAEQALPKGTRKTTYANDRPLPEKLVRSWEETATRFGLQGGVVTSKAVMDPIRRINREAFEIEVITPRTWLESAYLMRIGPSAIAENPDGISLNTPLVRVLHTLGFFNPLEVPLKGSTPFNRLMQRWDPFENASGFLWLSSSDNRLATQLASGRAYVRAHLWAALSTAPSLGFGCSGRDASNVRACRIRH